MSANQYTIYNGAMQTIAKPAAVTTGTAIKTMLQVAPNEGIELAIIEWGISFSGYAAAAKISVELIETDVAATVTSIVEAGITKRGTPTGPLWYAKYGLAAGVESTGHTATTEDTTTALRNLHGPLLLAPTDTVQFFYPLGREPIVGAGKFARIRVHAPAAVDCLCYMVVEPR